MTRGMEIRERIVELYEEYQGFASEIGRGEELREIENEAEELLLEFKKIISGTSALNPETRMDEILMEFAEIMLPRVCYENLGYLVYDENPVVCKAGQIYVLI